MEADFWHQKWQNRQIGFHQSDINSFLLRYWSALDLAADATVLVPLCGKSLDMMWLKQQGHRVLGVELSQQALDEFLQENGLSGQFPVEHHHFCGYRLPDLCLFCGDFFHLNAQDCESVKAVYDRAALVALPAEMRQAYAAHLIEVLPPQTQMLVITMEYEGEASGPPFSVKQSEVEGLYQDHFQVRLLTEKTAERRGTEVTEKVFLLTPRAEP